MVRPVASVLLVAALGMLDVCYGAPRAPSPPPPPLPVPDLSVATTTSGPVRGFVGNAFRMWRGIPFAEPPTGSRRWMPPVPKASWAPEIFEAFDTSQNCAQSEGYGGWSPPGPADPQTSSEDCL